MLGSALFLLCLDRSSSRRAWIGVLLVVLGSAFFSPCLDWSFKSTLVADRCAWIGALLVMLGSEFLSPCLDRRSSRCAWIRVSDRRCAWIEVSDGNFRSAFEFQMEISTWIGVSDRRCAPCLDRNFRESGIERSFREE